MHLRKTLIGIGSLFSLSLFGSQDIKAATAFLDIPISTIIKYQCTFTASTSIIFNPITSDRTFQDDKDGSLTVKCSGAVNPITLALKHGLAGSYDFTAATLTHAGHKLIYQVFTDPTRQILYTGDFYTTINAPANINVAIPIYARLVGGQQVFQEGIYKDSIIAEIAW